MLFIDLITAVIIGIVLTLVFTLGFRRRGPWASVLLFFLIIFLGSWAAGIWVRPVGPAFRGVSWLPALMGGLVLALLLAAAFPPAAPRSRRREEIELERKVTPVVMAIDAFFIVLIVLLALVIVIGYLAGRP